MDSLLQIVLLPVLGVFDLIQQISIFGVPFYAYVIVFVVLGLIIGFLRG